MYVLWNTAHCVQGGLPLDKCVLYRTAALVRNWGVA